MSATGTNGGRAGASAPARLVEIAGVAGAGKSTLTGLLCGGSGEYRRAEFIRTRKLGHLVYVARSIPRLLPILAANTLARPRLNWADFKLMVFVTQWHRFLNRRPSVGTVVFDQGPIYALVRLEAQERAVARHPAFRRWWEEMLTLWTGTLDTIVWLDAPDAVLRSRIEERTQSHHVKGETVDASLAFISRYRSLFVGVLDRCAVAGRPRLLRFDTGVTSAQGVAAEIRSELSTPRPSG